MMHAISWYLNAQINNLVLANISNTYVALLISL